MGIFLIVFIFFIFYNGPTNAQLFHRLSHPSYIFRHNRVIIRELVVSTLPLYTTMLMQLLVIKFKIISHMFYVVKTSLFKIVKILKLSYL